MPLFQVGQPVVIQHRKPWRPGRPIQLQGTVALFDGLTLIVERRFHHPGQRYDGLYADQEAGDWGTVELHRGGWISRRNYLRQDGSLIGELYNLQTPTRFYPGTVVYTDLEIDVARLPGSPARVEIQDVDELDAATRRGHIPVDVDRIARQLADELAQRLRSWNGPGEPPWDLRPDERLVTPAVKSFLRQGENVI